MPGLRVGNQSNWSAPVCTSLAIDDRSLTASAGWTQGAGGQYIDDTYTSSTTKSATLSLTGVHADRLALVATACDGCGEIAVTFPGLPKTIIDLQSSSTLVRIYFLPTFTKLKTGTVTLTIASNREPVDIDAIGASQS